MYLPSTSKVCDMKGPRIVSKILTHFFASVCEQGGNLMCFSNEESEREGYKIQKIREIFAYIRYHYYIRKDTHKQNVSKIRK